jgi:hypothetical protein
LGSTLRHALRNPYRDRLLPADRRLDALRRQFAEKWPADSGWAERVERTSGLVSSGVVRGGSIAVALTNILALIGQIVR